jgi:hypothetical protein
MFPTFPFTRREARGMLRAMSIPRSVLLLPVLAFAAIFGCQCNNASSGNNAGPVDANTAPPASASATTSASTDVPGPTDSGAADDSGDDAATAVDAGRKADAGGLACGTKPLPDCPMQAWMKANTGAAMQSKNFAALAAALDQVVKMQPPGYAGWAQIAQDGAKAARAQDIDAVKQSCKSCHGQFQKRFQADVTLRPRKI